MGTAPFWYTYCRMMWRQVLAGLTLVSAVFSQTDYRNQDLWPGKCLTGKVQSPINIDPHSRVDPKLKRLELRNYNEMLMGTISNEEEKLTIRLESGTKGIRLKDVQFIGEIVLNSDLITDLEMNSSQGNLHVITAKKSTIHLQPRSPLGTRRRYWPFLGYSRRLAAVVIPNGMGSSTLSNQRIPSLLLLMESLLIWS